MSRTSLLDMRRAGCLKTAGSLVFPSTPFQDFFQLFQDPPGPQEFGGQDGQPQGDDDQGRPWQNDHCCSDDQKRKTDDRHKEPFGRPETLSFPEIHSDLLPRVFHLHEDIQGPASNQDFPPGVFLRTRIT
jgi:hypothetical protein